MGTATWAPSSAPAASPLPGPPLLATAARPPSMEPVLMPMERGVPMLMPMPMLTTAMDTVLLTDTVLPTAMASLSTPVSLPPSATGLPRVFTVSSATTTARGAPSPSTATTATALESTTTTSTLASTATTTPTVCPDAPSLP